MVAEKFANFIAGTTYDALPDEIVAAAKERILDTIGAAVAGSANWEYRDNFLNACRSFGQGCWNVIGSPAREFPLARAAMINSTFAHAIELDDGHKNAGVHAGASVVPTALTLGAGFGSTGKDVITAVVLGYDIVYRLASSMAPYQIEKGFHPSGNDDTVGAAAVAATPAQPQTSSGEMDALLKNAESAPVTQAPVPTTGSDSQAPAPTTVSDSQAPAPTGAQAPAPTEVKTEVVSGNSMPFEVDRDGVTLDEFEYVMSRFSGTDLFTDANGNKSGTTYGISPNTSNFYLLG